MRFDLDVPTLRAMLWANRALGQIRRQLKRGELQSLEVAPAPRLPRTAALGVSEVLRRRRTTCLEEVLVIQRWKAAQNEPVDVIVGIKPGEDLFRAHAWIDGDGTVEEGFEELFRVAPP
jgi:hypothetical protein